MAYDYDALYATTPNALGKPAPELVKFFRSYDGPALRVLDIGCGQGRDAVFVARLGHTVVGVDIAPHGIRDLNAEAQARSLPIIGIVRDVVTYLPDAHCDILLLDRTLHMLPDHQRIATLRRLIDFVSDDGCVLIVDERSNMAGFKAVFKNHRADWSITYENKGYLFVRHNARTAPKQ